MLSRAASRALKSTIRRQPTIIDSPSLALLGDTPLDTNDDDGDEPVATTIVPPLGCDDGGDTTAAVAAAAAAVAVATVADGMAIG